ncbi:hypothetical protein ACIA5C_00525 [Actinoplanes sp. NPDC051343]|uniref:hypothetical protein n=1 Tax=Actinoplanes sp. NPDC051343 TaxID=3363906 RepID=UPI0037AF7301
MNSETYLTSRFIGVFDPEINTDEYDCMIQPLLEMLAAVADADDAAQFLDGEITGHFGMSPGMGGNGLDGERQILYSPGP